MKVFKRILKIIGIILGAIVLCALIFLFVMTVSEYKPKDVEPLEITGDAKLIPVTGQDYTIMTWNIGYGALFDEADFFMDGGKGVNTATEDEVYNNLAFMTDKILKINPDVLFVQEMDINSKRSHGVNEEKFFSDSLEGYDEAFAYNFKVLYVPYPVPAMGHIESGVCVFSKFDLTDAMRKSLPCPFSYPIRTCNLKRCLNITRTPVEGTEKELVLIDLHLEAYDSGEGKIAQTNMLKSILEEEIEKGNYVIAGGDFNQVFSNIDSKKYETGREGLWIPGEIDVKEYEKITFEMDDSVPTCRSLDQPYKDTKESNFQFYVIDGFAVSDNVWVKSVETMDYDFEASDHNPVVMKFQLIK